MSRRLDAVLFVVESERVRSEVARRTLEDLQHGGANIVGAVDLFERPEIRLMMKEAPHDFFLTHPANPKPGTIGRPTLIEFDAAGEYNGQGVIINTWPEFFLERWRAFADRPHIAGYVARVAEEAAAMDLMSGGNYCLGIGLGYRDAEFDASGVRLRSASGRSR